MKVHDKVRFSEGYLKATKQVTGPEPPTHIGPFARGTVIDIHEGIGSGVCTVRWANGCIRKVFRLNLEVSP